MSNLDNDFYALHNKELDEIRKSSLKGQSIVFTNGVFDLLHEGHLFIIEKCRSFGDVVVVGVNSDESTSRLKGHSRPIQSLSERLRALRSRTMADFFVAYDEDTPLKLIREIRPNVLVKGGDYAASEVVGGDFVQIYGGRIEIVERLGDFSTSKLVESLRDQSTLHSKSGRRI